MKAIWSWTITEEGCFFQAQCDGQTLSPEEWAGYDLTSLEGKRVGPGALWRLLEDEEAVEQEDGTVLTPHLVVARLSPGELQRLALPEPWSFVLHLESRGRLLSDPDFCFHYQFWHPQQVSVVNFRRTGCLIEVGGQKFILSEPYYSIVENIDRFNAAPPVDTQARLLAWGVLRELLPKEAILDNYLSSINVVKADYFSLDAFLNDDGQPDFDPVLIRKPKGLDTGMDSVTPSDVEPILPPAAQEFFAKHFRRSSGAKTQYAVGSGWFAVVSEALRQALEVVRRYQQANPEVRRRFLSNPRPFLKEHLGEHFDDAIVSELFQETSRYSERVKEIGVWNPPVLPFLQKISKEPWLPPESLGIRVGDDWIIVNPEDVEPLRQMLTEAQQKGLPNIKYKGKIVPATQQAIEALDQLVSLARPDKPDHPPLPQKDKYVLLIKGNFEDLEICHQQKNQRPGQVGRLPIDFLMTELLPHQRDGLFWLQEHWVKGSPGAVLADDMGLGKTLQALAFLAWVRQLLEGPFLVVAPTGLLDEWVQQHEQHLNPPGLGRLIKAYGRALRELRKPEAGNLAEIEGGAPVLNVGKLCKANWVLATYETIRDYQHSFGQIKWQVVVFDEAQKIKNPSALMTHAAKALQMNFGLALSGTPVENRPADIWCIVDTVRPGELGSLKDFSTRYEKDGNLETVALSDLNKILTERKKPPALLRRLKGEYLQGLPPKSVHVREKEMPALQADAYDQAVAWAKTNARGPGGILEALHRLRSVSLHPLDFKTSGLSLDEYIRNSARLSLGIEILDAIARQGEKALIFLESLDMQGYLVELIQKRYGLAQAPMIINGTVSGPKRKERIEKFQRQGGFDVMILSPKAGGVGFTLTAANHVIHLSRWWNPAVEDQCTDRVYRISQYKPVHIYYPLARHPHWGISSFDLRLHALLEDKRKLCQTILAPSAASPSDADRLFMETVWAQDPSLLNQIDCMEPRMFEDWVLDRLRNAGYKVTRTPVTGDSGADGLVMAPNKSGQPNLIIQAKHTQRDDFCSEAAVDQVLKAVRSYHELSPPVLLVVVTNARAFSKSAIKKAQDQGVLLVDREGLCSWPEQVMKEVETRRFP